MNLHRICGVFLSFLLGQAAVANDRVAHVLSIGQGISSPSVTSTVNWSTGYTNENPVGVVYQNGLRLSGQFDKNGNEAYGGEIGYGQNGWGVAAGYRQVDCEDCDGDAMGAIGLTVGSSFSFGLRFQEELYAAGLILNPLGSMRFGLMAELSDPEGEDNNVSAFGVGMSYVASDFTFSIDASKRDYEAEGANDDYVRVTPGLMLRADILQVSVNYNMTVNDEDAEVEDDDDLWFGVGLGGDQWHLAFYSDYVNDISIVGSLFF